MAGVRIRRRSLREGEVASTARQKWGKRRGGTIQDHAQEGRILRGAVFSHRLQGDRANS